MFSRLNITAKGLILVIVPVILEVIFASYLGYMLSDTFVKLVRMQRSAAALSVLTEERHELMKALFVAMDATEPDINKRMNALNNLDIQMMPALLQADRSFPELNEFADQLESLHTHIKALIEKYKKQLSDPKMAHSYGMNLSESELMPVFLEARGISDSAFEVEKQLGMLQPHEMKRFEANFQTWLVLVLLTSYGICFAISRAFTKDIARRLGGIANNTKLISIQKPLSPVQSGNDEIAELDAAVHNAGQELEEARKRELAILDNASDVLCSADNNLKLLDIGKAATRHWGYDLDELMGRSLLSILSDDCLEATRNKFDAIAKDTFEGQIENRIRCKNGSEKNFLWTIKWRTQDKLFYCVARDVTQLRAMEKLKQEFLAMVSHDLRTPLNSVSIGLSMLAENRLGELPESVQAQLTKSRKSMNRLSHLVHDLLELEKAGSGKMVLDLEVSSAAEICGYAKEQLEPLASNAQVKVSGPSGDAAVLVDVKRLTQALVNLISNAIKFSPPNSSISLAVCTIGNFAEISVSDSGPGIQTELQQQIFDRFQQAEIARSKSLRSTGLGLAIVQMIIKEHGGEVGVESEVGKGSRFWVRVPKLADEEEAP